MMSTNSRRKRCDIPATTMVGFLGGGRMAQAMARGIISSGLLQPAQIWASDPNPPNHKLIQSLGVTTTSKNEEVVKNTQVIIIAVKPNVVKSLLKEVSPFITKDKLIVSIAAGVRISTIEELLPPESRVIRVMPNTPALVQAGASVLASGSAVLKGDNDLVAELLSGIGISEEGSEANLDAVTGVSGSGPAYAFAAIEALSDGGVKMGLPRALSTKLAAQTLLGAAKMVLETGKHPGQLKDEVCSPGGTTIHAMHALEKAGFRAALIDAVEAAAKHSQFLGKLS